MRGASAEDKALVAHVIAAANVIEHIYDEQLGTAALAAEIPEGDTASRMLFYRNHGPFCDAPTTEKDPDCNALPRRPARVSGLYPASLQRDPKFCEKLDARPDQKALTDPFTVVVDRGGDLAAVPYHVAYKDEMAAVSRELAAAAAAITSPGEAALKAYLEADAQELPRRRLGARGRGLGEDGRQQLEVVPARRPRRDLRRPVQPQGRLPGELRPDQPGLASPGRRSSSRVKGEMEGAIARLSGPPYKARKVTFHLPDFIDVVLNAGDARSPARRHRGREPAQLGARRQRGARPHGGHDQLLHGPGQPRRVPRSGRVAPLQGLARPGRARPGDVRHHEHRAARGVAQPRALAHEYKVKGKKDEEVFGGPLAGTLEELKAQTSALYLADWLVGKKVIDARTERLAHVSDVIWAFGHIAQGMYTANGTPKPYPQLASIQLGSFLAAKALAFHGDEAAANGRDKGCFAIDDRRLPAAIEALERRVLGVKSRGDKAGAVKMREALVDGDGEWKRLRAVIEERWRRAPRASFVYDVELY